MPWIPFDVLAFDEKRFPDFAEFGSSLAVQVKHHGFFAMSCALLIVYDTGLEASKHGCFS